VKDRGFDLVGVAQTVNFPMGVYSKKVKSLDELADGATVAIPNDPTNGGRALLILADKGLIKVDAAKGLKIGPADRHREPEEPRIRRTTTPPSCRARSTTSTTSVINTNYALEAGLDPAKDPIAREGEKAPYINVIAVKSADKDAAWVKTLVESYHSDAVKAFVAEQFKGAVIAAW